MNDQQRFIVKRLSDDSPIRRLQLTCAIDDQELGTIVGFFYDERHAQIAAQALDKQDSMKQYQQLHF